MKTKIDIGILIIVVVCLAAFKSTSNIHASKSKKTILNEKDSIILVLINKINRLEQKVNNLESAKTFNKNYSDLKKIVEENTSDIDEIQGFGSGLFNKDLQELEDLIENNERDISNLKSDVSNLRSDISNLENHSH